MLVRTFLGRFLFQSVTRSHTRFISRNAIPLEGISDLPYQPVVSLAEQQYKPSKSFAADSNLEPVVLLHGLFGSKQNYGGVGREITKRTGHPVYGLDLRNHGSSVHASPHDYYTLAKDVIAHLKERSWKDVVLVGHSMGAKTAMLVGLMEPDLVSKLVVVDNSPTSEPLEANFLADLTGMCEVEIEHTKNPGKIKEADIEGILSSYEPDSKVRFFLKTNIIKKPQERIFKVPVLNFLKDNVLHNLGDWPADKVEGRVYTKPTTVMIGIESNFIRSEHRADFKKYFPNATFEDYECGHWLVSEKPEQFVDSVVDFIENT